MVSKQNLEVSARVFIRATIYTCVNQLKVTKLLINEAKQRRTSTCIVLQQKHCNLRLLLIMSIFPRRSSEADQRAPWCFVFSIHISRAFQTKSGASWTAPRACLRIPLYFPRSLNSRKVTSDITAMSKSKWKIPMNAVKWDQVIFVFKLEQNI